MTPQQRNQQRQVSADFRSRTYRLQYVTVLQQSGNSTNGVSFAELMRQLRGGA